MRTLIDILHAVRKRPDPVAAVIEHAADDAVRHLLDTGRTTGREIFTEVEYLALRRALVEPTTREDAAEIERVLVAACGAPDRVLALAIVTATDYLMQAGATVRRAQHITGTAGGIH